MPKTVHVSRGIKALLPQTETETKLFPPSTHLSQTVIQSTPHTPWTTKMSTNKTLLFTSIPPNGLPDPSAGHLTLTDLGPFDLSTPPPPGGLILSILGTYFSPSRWLLLEILELLGPMGENNQFECGRRLLTNISSTCTIPCS